MTASKVRTSIGIRPTVVKWLAREKAERRYGQGPNELVTDSENTTRDLIVDQAVALLSHVQSQDTMKEIFGSEGAQVSTKLLTFLSTHIDPSE